MHDRDNLAPARGIFTGLWMGLTAWVCVGMAAWGAAELWRAAPDLTTGDWLALGCSTTLCWMGVRAGAKVWARKRRA